MTTERNVRRRTAACEQHVSCKPMVVTLSWPGSTRPPIPRHADRNHGAKVAGSSPAMTTERGGRGEAATPTHPRTVRKCEDFSHPWCHPRDGGIHEWVCPSAVVER